MTSVRHSATVHPETVSKAEKVAKKTAKDRATARRKPKPAPAPVQTKYLKKPKDFNPKVWDVGMILAHKHPKRIIPLSNDTLIVVNDERLGVPGE